MRKKLRVITNYLLRKNKYKTENYTYLLFYYPNKVLESGDVVFDTKLIKVKTSAKRGEKVFKEAVKLLNSNKMPRKNKNCEFCKYKDF